MKQNFFTGFCISTFIHLMLISSIAGLFSFQLPSFTKISKVTPLNVYAIQEEKIIKKIQEFNSTEIKLPKIPKDSQINKIEPLQIKIEDPSELLEILKLKEFINLDIQEKYTDNVIKYTNIIKTQVINQWKQPASSRVGMEVQLAISMLPSGEIVNVTVIKKSADEAFDRSAIIAVKSLDIVRGIDKMPRNIFNRNFRNFILVFAPEK